MTPHWQADSLPPSHLGSLHKKAIKMEKDEGKERGGKRKRGGGEDRD